MLLPGAGLAYCKRPLLGFANLLVAVLLPLACLSVGFLREHVLWIFLGIAAGSAGLAHSFASRSE